MKIILKDGTGFNVTNVTETKLANMWILNFVILDDVSTSDVDNIFHTENFQQISFVNDNEEITYLRDYTQLNRAVISHSNTTSQITMQMSKSITSTEVIKNET